MTITSQFPSLGFDKFWVSPPEYFELRERAKSFSEIGAYRANAVNLSERDTPERVVRSTPPIESLARVVRESVNAQDRSLPIVRLRTMDDVFSDSIARQRFLAQLLGLFAGLALALAAVATYGVLSYLGDGATAGDRHPHGVRRRSRERVVAGAQAAAGDAVIGLVVGVGGALARLASSLLFEAKPTDRITFAAVAAVITLVALLAYVVPARRATKVDPMVALREE